MVSFWIFPTSIWSFFFLHFLADNSRESSTSINIGLNETLLTQLIDEVESTKPNKNNVSQIESLSLFPNQDQFILFLERKKFQKAKDGFCCLRFCQEPAMNLPYSYGLCKNDLLKVLKKDDFIPKLPSKHPDSAALVTMCLILADGKFEPKNDTNLCCISSCHSLTTNQWKLPICKRHVIFYSRLSFQVTFLQPSKEDQKEGLLEEKEAFLDPKLLQERIDNWVQMRSSSILSWFKPEEDCRYSSCLESACSLKFTYGLCFYHFIQAVLYCVKVEKTFAFLVFLHCVNFVCFSGHFFKSSVVDNVCKWFLWFNSSCSASH